MNKVWNHNKISYGGDYNPEQWDEATWEEDMRMFKVANIDTVTINVFSWASLQSDENTYHFEKLDKIMKMATDNNLKVCLATSTAAHPAWMAKKYPEILRTDFQGRKHKFGGRHNSCSNSLVYQKYSTKIARLLADRYKDYDNILAWHISNEYGGECYCENCEKAFRVWVQDRYKTIEELNRAWNTAFWGHTFYEWDEIVLPNILSEHFEMCGRDCTQFQSISIDYRRFNSDSMLKCYRMEYDAIKEITPNIPITTNLMAFYKPLDYQKWAKYMDFASWDSYPSNSDSPARMSINHDLIRGLKGGAPFVLMEQTPSVTNWQPYNALKRPGVMRLWSYQAIAHGADTVMFFQMRRSIGACEKYHGAIIDHAGRENTRVFREATVLGEELNILQDVTLGARQESKVAILFDWDNWWGVEYSAGPSILMKYHDEVINYYEALHSQNIGVDIIGVDDSLDKYDVVIAPILYMVKGNYDEKVRSYVKKGGTFVTTFFSGYVDDSDIVVGAYPGKLSDILGIWVEESDALPEGNTNSFIYQEKTYEASLLCDIIHLEGASRLADYEEDFYAGSPVITENKFGSGKAYYVGARSNAEFYKQFTSDICKEKDIKPMYAPIEGVEAVVREQEDYSILFLLNHSNEDREIIMDNTYENLLDKSIIEENAHFTLKKKDVLILKKDK